jgi:hypothetical protein
MSTAISKQAIAVKLSQAPVGWNPGHAPYAPGSSPATIPTQLPQCVRPRVGHESLLATPAHAHPHAQTRQTETLVHASSPHPDRLRITSCRTTLVVDSPDNTRPGPCRFAHQTRTNGREVRSTLSDRVTSQPTGSVPDNHDPVMWQAPESVLSHCRPSLLLLSLNYLLIQ